MNQKAYIQLSDSTDQTPSTISPTLVQFDTQDAVLGIGHDVNQSTDIEILEDGVYFALAAGQVGRKSGSLLRFIDLWFRINGEDVPNSTVRASAPASLFVGDTFVLVVQAVLPLKKGNVFGTCMAVSDPNDGLGLMVTNPDGRPRIPSVIFTMYQI